jgi:hypothetical protein
MDRVSYLSKEYTFASEPEINEYIKRAQDETIDSLYTKVKSIWKKYIDADDFHIAICAGDTIFTYFQDKFGMTHYLLFVGDVEMGKTNNIMVLQQLAYRALYSISLTPASIYRSLGSIEEGQVTILEDEIDNIEKQDEKMRIYKAGYKAGVKVPRNDDTPSGRKSQGYFAYCFKAFTSEKPDSIEAKGFNERTFVIKCSVGCPDYDISEVTSPADDGDYKAQLDELTDMRKLLLINRLLHCNEPIPDIDITLKNRDKQLCKPLIRLFQGTKAVGEISESLWKLLEEKKNRKAGTIDARVYNVVMNLVKQAKPKQSLLNDDEIELTSAEIRDSIKAELKGSDIYTKPKGGDSDTPVKSQSFDTEEYGMISQKLIASILEDRFGGDKVKDVRDGLRGFRFSKKKSERLGANYSNEGIKIQSKPKANPSGTSGTSGGLRTCTDSVTHSKTTKSTENGDICNIGDENMQENCRDVEDFTGKTFQ